MTKNVLLWGLIVILAAVAVVLGIQLRAAQAQLRNAQQQIADITTVPQTLTSLKSVVFVRADTSSLTYRIPRIDTENGQQFVNYDEKTATYSALSVQLLGTLVHQSADALQKLPEGTHISILLSADGSSITEIYVPAQ